MPTAFALIIVVSGETCAVPNDDTLVGKADEKVNEHHSPQAGRDPILNSEIGCLEVIIGR